MKTFLKHIIFVFAMAAGLSLALTSCGNLFESPSENKKESPTQEGSVAQNSKNCFITLSVNEANTRAALPDLTLEDFTFFTLSGNLDGSEDTNSEILGTYNSYDSLTQAKIAISAGKWTFTLSAKKGGAVYSGKTTATITEGENTLSFTLKLKSIAEEEGKGDFEIQVNLSSPEVSETAKITAELCTVNSDGTAGSVIFLEEELTINPEKRTTYKKSQIQNGTYTALFSLYNAEGTKVGSFIEYIGIAKDCKSTSSIGIASLECFTITYNPNAEGDTVTGITGRGSYSHYDEVSFPENPVRKGYDFGGWFTDADCTGTKVTGTDGLSGNITLYAKWTLTTYSITYVGVPAGITNPNEAITSYTIKNDDIKIKSITGDDILYYWYDAETDGNRVTEIESGSTGNVTLFAREITYVELKTGKEINDIFKKSLNAGAAISFDRSETAPAENDTVFYLDISESSVPVWYDSKNKIIYYYVNGHFLRLNEDSSGMFEGMSQLQTITTKNFDTSIVTNMSSMFYRCNNLISLDVSNFDTSNVTDMSSLFYRCSHLKSIDVSNFDTSNVTNMKEMFYICESLEFLDVTNFNTSNVTDMSRLFYYCSHLKSIDVSNFDTSNVTNMKEMFYVCESLEFLDVTNFNTSKVKDMSGMFALYSYFKPSYSYLISKLDLSNFDTSNVTNMSNMFSFCGGLTSLDLSNFDTRNVTNMQAMFYGCSKLASLDLSNFNTRNVTDMSFMFADCIRLKSLDLSNFDTSNVSDMSWMFSYAESILHYDIDMDLLRAGKIGLSSLDLSNFDTSNVTNMQYMFYFCASLSSLDLSNFDTSNVTDMSGMFFNCQSLTLLDVSNFETSNVTNMSEMFNSCTNLTSLDLSSFDTSNVTTMRMMFGCKNLTFLDLSSFDTSNVTDMDYMFYSCASLSSLDLSNFDTSNVTDMDYMFYSCASLSSLDLSNFDTSNVTDMSGMFGKCQSLTLLDVSNFETSNVTDMSEMFDSCTNLTSLDLSSFDTSNVTDMSEMFDSCTNLTSLDLSSFDTSNVTDMDYMFHLCTGLTKLDLSKFNTSNLYSMSYMFGSCSSLETIDLSSFDIKNVSSMYGLFSCHAKESNLKTIYVSPNTDWSSSSKITSSGNMFFGCISITGGKGTTYDESHTGKTYARIDEGPDKPGYFTVVGGAAAEEQTGIHSNS